MLSTAPAQNRVSPFYESLRQQLREEFITGREPGERLPSERQIAKQFESSPMTVGRILQEFQAEGLLERVQGKGSFIKEAPAAGPTLRIDINGDAPTPEVAHGASDLHWSPVQGGRETFLRHTVIIATLNRDSDPHAREYWAHRIVSVAELKLQRAKVRTTIINRNDYEGGEIESLFAELKADGVDSILFVEHGRVTIQWRRGLVRLKHELGEALTVVQVDFGNENLLPFDSVTFCGQSGSFDATMHLAELGHREICFLAKLPHERWIQARLEGFWQALELKGLGTRPLPDADPATDGHVFYANEPTDEAHVYNAWPYLAHDVAQQFFAHENARHRFTGVVAVNDDVAAELVRVARERGLKVPDDISVVGFDDKLHSKSEGLTTVQPPIEKLGEVAADILLKRDGARQSIDQLHVSLKPSLVIRASTRAFKEDAAPTA